MSRPSAAAKLWIVILAGIALLGLPLLALPYGRDQAIFALTGEIVARGGFPYRDAFDFKPPGIHAVYALAALFAPGALWLPRLFDLVALLLGIAALFRLVEPNGRRAAAIAGVHLGLAYLACFRYWDYAQPEIFLMALLLWSLVLYRDGGRAGALAAGACLGAAFLMKYTAVLYLPLYWMLARRESQRSAGSRGAALALGATLPVLTAVIYLAAGRALAPFLEIQTAYLPGYSRLLFGAGFLRAFGRELAVAGEFFLERPFLLGPPLVGMFLRAVANVRQTAPAGASGPGFARHKPGFAGWGPVLMLSKRAPQAWVPLLGIAASFAGVLSQGKLFPYHWIPILPFLAWTTGAGFEAALARLGPSRTRVRALAALLAVLGLGTLAGSGRALVAERVPLLAYVSGRLTRAQFFEQPAFGTIGYKDYALGATWQAAEIVTQLCAPQDRVFVWGFEPLVYIASRRAPASRFIYNAPLLSPWCPAAWRDEAMQALLTDPPAVLVILSDDAMPWVTGLDADSRTALRLYPPLVRLLKERYTRVRQLEHFTFYVLDR